jgi:DNA repair exonuclease SbcCD ATPase subunit
MFNCNSFKNIVSIDLFLEVVFVRIKIENFGGVKMWEGELVPGTKIVGANGSGKTSIMKAYLWCLFGILPDGKKVFTSIKPVSHETSVVEIEHGGKVFKKVVEWGESKDKVIYMIDGKPVNKATYTVVVEDHFGAKTERLMTLACPGYFDYWDKDVLRKWLFHIAGVTFAISGLEGNISSAKTHVKRGKEELKTIEGKLEAYKEMLGDYKDVKYTTGKIDKRIIMLQGKIAELKANKDTLLSKMGLIEWQNDIENIKLKIKQLESDADKFVANLIADRNKQIDELMKERYKIEDELKKQYELELQHQKRAKDAALNRKAKIEEKINLLKSEIALFKDRLISLKEKRKKLLEEYKKKDSEFKTIDTLCPYCGTKLTDEDLIFDLKRNAKEELNRLKKEGVETKKEIIHTESDVSIKERRIKELEVELKGIIIPDVNVEMPESDRIKEIDKIIEDLRNKEIIPPTSITAKIKEYKNELKKLLSAKPTFSEADIAKINSEIEEYESQIDKLRELRATVEKKDTIIKNMKNLEKRYDEVLKIIERNQNIIDSAEEEKRNKILQIENDVNKLFSTVKWKMYEVLKNGEHREICIPVNDKGVRYWNMSAAERINAGIDICLSLQKALNVKLPVVVDNADLVPNLYSENDIVAIYVDNNVDKPTVVQ